MIRDGLHQSQITDPKSSMTKFPGGYRGRVTPVPIPNTEVKPATADGTAWVTVWESRSPPGLFLGPREVIHAALFLSAHFHSPAHSHTRRRRHRRRPWPSSATGR